MTVRPDAFAAIPRAILTNPPLRHRGSDQGLGVFAFVVGLTTVQLVRIAMAADRQSVRTDHNEHRRVARRFNFPLGALDGRRLVTKAAQPILHITRSGLLTAAGFSRKSKNARALTTALDDLTTPVRIGRRDWSGPLVDWSESNGILRIVVDRDWLEPRGGFVFVPWPPPKGGPVILALYLLAFGLDLRPESDAALKRTTFYARLGVHHRWATKALTNAVKVVNAYLAQLDRDALAAYRVYAPTKVALLELRSGGLVRLVEKHPAVAMDPLGDGPLDSDDAAYRVARERALDRHKQLANDDDTERALEEIFGAAPDAERAPSPLKARPFAPESAPLRPRKRAPSPPVKRT